MAGTRPTLQVSEEIREDMMFLRVDMMFLWKVGGFNKTTNRLAVGWLGHHPNPKPQELF
jgi:hypothetical protein